MRPGPILPKYQRDFAGFAGISSSFAYNKTFALVAQVDAHTALYRDSALVQTGSYSAALSFGGSFRLDGDWRLNVGLTEDLHVNASPDIGFHLEVSTLF